MVETGADGNIRANSKYSCASLNRPGTTPSPCFVIIEGGTTGVVDTGTGVAVGAGTGVLTAGVVISPTGFEARASNCAWYTLR